MTAPTCRCGRVDARTRWLLEFDVRRTLDEPRRRGAPCMHVGSCGNAAEASRFSTDAPGASYLRTLARCRARASFPRYRRGHRASTRKSTCGQARLPMTRTTTPRRTGGSCSGASAWNARDRSNARSGHPAGCPGSSDPGMRRSSPWNDAVPHAHCPRCQNRVTQVATYWTNGPGPLRQHTTCSACGARLVRDPSSATAQRWALEPPAVERDE
jgi:hypothetical protein